MKGPSPARGLVAGALALPVLLGAAGARASQVPAEARAERPPPLAAGRAALEAGDWERAQSLLEEAVVRAPESAAAHALLGRALALQQSPAAGLRHLERAVALGDDSLLTRTYLGSLLWEGGRLEEAEAALRAASAAGAAPAAHQLGRLLIWRGRYAEAVEVLQRLPVAGARGLDLEWDLARALEGAGRDSEALAAYRRLVALAPERTQPRYRFAVLLARVGDREGAAAEMATFDRLLRAEQARLQREGRERARHDQAWALLRAGRVDDAHRAFAALPESPDALKGLALASAAAGRHGEAVAALERAVSLAPERADLRLLLAEERLAAKGAGGAS